MWLMLMSIIVALLAGSCLLALVSDAFADALSRNVEAAFDCFEYRAARRQWLRREMQSGGGETAYAAAPLQRAA